MVSMTDERSLALAAPAIRSYTLEALVAHLGQQYDRWFSDSNETDLWLHLDWDCGCRADKSGVVDRLWRYEPCPHHAPAEPEPAAR
jgi:hypothetical protein